MDVWRELARAETGEGDTNRPAAARGNLRYPLQRLGTHVEQQFRVRNDPWHGSSAVNATRRPPKILIGGLGMGYTLRAVLDAVGREAKITVCELQKEIVEWNRGVLAPLAAHPLTDMRVKLRNVNVVEVIRDGGQVFDVVLLDTDNGPDFHPSSAQPRPLQIQRTCLRLAHPRSRRGRRFWSSTESAEFEDALDSIDWKWRRLRVELAVPGKQVFHVVYMAGRSLPQ